MADFDIRQVALPVFGAKTLPGVPSEVCGTAFAFGPGLLLTACHVAKQAATHPVSAIGFVEPGATTGACRVVSALVLETEINDSLDIAILRCDGGPYITPPWRPSVVDLLTEVVVAGYPHAMDVEAKELVVRSYRGHIVSTHPLRTLPAQPMAYELSFPCAVGMSGAPVLSRTMPPAVLGVVVQNGRSKMLVAREAEVVSNPAERTIVEMYEYLTFGLAVTSEAILAIESKLLGTTLGGYLGANTPKGA